MTFDSTTPLPELHTDRSESKVSPRSRAVALTLSVLLGWFGAHRFYVGKGATGVLQLLTIGGLGLWTLYDIILIAAGSFRDGDDRRVARWGESDRPSTTLDPQQLRALLHEMDLTRDEIADLAERVDFMERVLVRQRDRDRLAEG